MAFVPPVVEGCILRTSETPQFMYSPLNIQRCLVSNAAVRQQVVFQPEAPGTPITTISYDYADNNLKFSRNAQIKGQFYTNIVNATQSTKTEVFENDTLNLGVAQAYGSKGSPFNLDDSLGTLQMGSQNKLFFQYTPNLYQDGVVIVNDLVETAAVFVKDVYGINDIPNISVELKNINAGEGVPFVIINNIPPDPDGMSRGMLLFL